MEVVNLCGDNAYNCDKCKGKTDAVKTVKFENAPPLLVLRVCRADWEVKKIQTHIKFPIEGFNLKAYYQEDVDCLYDLCSVVVHHGRGLNEGHYTAMAKNYLSKSWFLFNDQRVTPTEVEEVDQSQCYMLFYQKRN